MLVSVPVGQRRNERLRGSIGTLIYAAVFGVAFISAPLALALVGVTAVYYVFAPVPHVGIEAEVDELTSGPL